MQRGDDYMMRQIPSYRDNPAMASTPELQDYYDDPVRTRPPSRPYIYIYLV